MLREGVTEEQGSETIAEDFFDVEDGLQKALKGDWESRLQTESHEEAEQTLKEIQALRKWRLAVQQSPWKDFYQFFEVASNINQQQLLLDRQKELRTALVDRLIEKSRNMSPRVSDFYQALLADFESRDYQPQFSATQSEIQRLKESGDLNLLENPNIPYNIKLNRIKSRIEGLLAGKKSYDQLDKQKQMTENQKETEEIQEQLRTPPPAQDESKPSMDEMERSKEGEMPPAIWTISPGYGGYYREQSFEKWDSARNKWTQEYQYQDPIYLEDEPLSFDPTVEQPKKLNLKVQLPINRNVRVPLPYQFNLAESIEGQANLLVDQNGDYSLSVDQIGQTGEKTLNILLMQNPDRRFDNKDFQQQPKAIPQFNISNISPEIKIYLQEINNSRKGNLAKAKAVCSCVIRTLKYSNDSSFNQIYESDPNGYITAIDTHKQADCDVANTYFAALCSSLNIPVRHVTGHMVKGKNKEGNSEMTSGTGHAWSEVWDDEQNIWVRIDATPAGDPLLEEDQEEGESVEGDYGEKEAIGLTDDQLVELEKKLAELTEKLSYTAEERQLAEAANIELAEARQIVKEIQTAEDTKLADGTKVVDMLSQLFSLIIESRRIGLPDNTGPLRQREGGEEIENIVAHKIGIKAHDADPRSRQKASEIIKEEQIFDGFDVYIIGDKSGSMSEIVEGETKWQLQRRAEYLIFSSLYRFSQNLERSRANIIQPLSVRSQGISFRNSDEIDEDKPLSADFLPLDKVKLWRSLGNQGIGNGDVAALQHIYQQISAEREEAFNQSKEDNRLRLVIVCSDGYPEDTAKVHKLASDLGSLNAVVVGIGLTETANAVPTIFNTEFSRGDIAKDINDLPVIVAKHLVLSAIKLFPEKAKKSSEQILTNLLDKFNRKA